MKETKKIIQQSMDDSTMNTVMSNRLSWRKFDTIRKTQTLDNSSALNQRPSKTDESPPSKRKHGSLSFLSKAMQEDILAKASAWSDNETVNWSSLARQHGITKPNGGQSVKEFLRDHNIPAASKEECEGRSLRRKRKVLP